MKGGLIMPIIDFCTSYLNEEANIVCLYHGACMFKGKVQDFPFDDCEVTVKKVESFDAEMMVLIVE